MSPLWYYFKRKTPQTFKPVILITGCGSGIGLALADLLYRQNQYRVVVTARRSSLPALRERFHEDPERFWLRSLDVTVETERDALISEIKEKWQRVNILINNAGISYRAVVEHMTEADEIKQMATNYLGPAALIRLVLPMMREKGRGKIINISSVSGMLAMPTMASYSASKYALEGMSEALWYETRPLGINVCLVQPGFIFSNSFKKVYYTESSRPEICIDGIYCDYYHHMTPFIDRLMRRSLATPEKIAKLVLKVIHTESAAVDSGNLGCPDFLLHPADSTTRLLLPVLFNLLPHARQWGEKYSKSRQRFS